MFQSGISKRSRKDQLNKIIQSNNPVDFNQRKGLFSSSLSRVHFDRTTQVPGARSPAYSLFPSSLSRVCFERTTKVPRFALLFSSSLSRVYCKRTTQVKLCKAFLYVCSGKGLANKIKGFFNIQEKVAYFSHRTIKIPNLSYKKTCLGTHCSLNSVCSLRERKVISALSKLLNLLAF